jgi:hypothetical protein
VAQNESCYATAGLSSGVLRPFIVRQVHRMVRPLIITPHEPLGDFRASNLRPQGMPSKPLVPIAIDPIATTGTSVLSGG